MRKKIDREKQVESYAFDFVIVGGSPGGLSAALIASRFGLKTAIIHNRPVLGGNASSEIGVSSNISGASGQGWCLGGVKTLPRMEGGEMEIRCDLHPRWNRTGDAISFDSLHEGFRGVYSMQIGPLLRQLAATTTQGASVEK
jgi:2-polyprenyl-6-methoxyphenol hydroxylase-like FAD-dependent oxidoreductase